jgi:membrane-bound lytic murein transglycosylase
VLGQESWTVGWVDDPSDGVQGAGDLNWNDLKRITVTVTYAQGADTDSVQLTRLLMR